MATIKFFKKATEPTTIETGNLWFDTTTQSIKVKTDTGYDVFGIGLKDAQLLNNKLTITRSDNTTVKVDFNDIASASSVAAALDKKVDKTITITGTGGLSGGGNLAESRTISHAVPVGAAAKTSWLYKIATDKFGHVTSTAAVTKTDITALGIPATDTNTTYSSSNPDSVIISTARLAFTASNAIKMDGLADLSGTYYIYCLSYMANGKVAVNGAVYA